MVEVGQGGAGGWGQGGGWGRLELWAGEGEEGGAIGRVRGLGQILWPWGHCRDFGFDSELGRDKIRRSTYVLACLQCRGQGVSLRGLSGAQCCFCHSACPCPPPGLAAAPASAPDHPVTSCPGHSLWQEKAVFFFAHGFGEEGSFLSAALAQCDTVTSPFSHLSKARKAV